MEFVEVRNLNKEIDVKIQDKISLKDLDTYMGKWGFSQITIEGIRADIRNDGQSYAVVKFSDAVRKSPSTFPKLVAALLHTGQKEVYNIYMDEIRKFYRTNEKRYKEVLAMIEKEKGELSQEHPDDSAAHSIHASGGLGQGIQDVTRGKLDQNFAGGLGEGVQDQFVSSVTPVKLDPNFAGRRISLLKASVYKMLGQELEQMNKHGDEKEPWWDHIINNGYVDVSRHEQRQIEDHKKPGVKFLDILADRGYTLQDLEGLFLRCNIDEAQALLCRNQNQVIEGGHFVRTDQINLNINQGAKVDQSNDMNIPEADSSDGPTAQSPLVSSVWSSLEEQVCAGEINRNSKARDLHLSTQLSNLSLESNSLQLIDDESVKGTTPVQAHGDRAGERAKPNPEQDSKKLQNDRVHQFDNDPAALEGTSFIPVNHEQLPVSNEMTRNGSDNRSECQMNINSLLQENADEVTNSESMPVIQAEPTGNIQMSSQFRSFDFSTESHSQDPSIRPEGIVNVSPRSLTSHEKDAMLRNIPLTTGVTYVTSSLSSADSRDEAGNNSVKQAGDSSTPASSGHLSDPDLIRGTELQRYASNS